MDNTINKFHNSYFKNKVVLANSKLHFLYDSIDKVTNRGFSYDPEEFLALSELASYLDNLELFCVLNEDFERFQVGYVDYAYTLFIEIRSIILAKGHTSNELVDNFEDYAKNFALTIETLDLI